MPPCDTHLVPDPIPPPAACQPAEALELAATALSDGDLEAALAQYEPGACLRTWQSAPGEAVGSALTCFIGLRLPLVTRIGTVLKADGVALVSCTRHTAGTGPDGEAVEYRGLGAAVVRAQPDGSWRIAADVWALDRTAAIPL